MDSAEPRRRAGSPRKRGSRAEVSHGRPNRPPRRRVAWAVVLPLGVGLLVQLWMAYDYFLSDPLYPYLQPPPTSEHGHNGHGVLGPGVVGVALELCTYLALVRPWRERCSLAGTACLAVLSLAWTVGAGLFAFEAGGVAFIHLLWMLAFDLYVLGLLGVLLVRRVR